MDNLREYNGRCVNHVCSGVQPDSAVYYLSLTFKQNYKLHNVHKTKCVIHNNLNTNKNNESPT